MTITALLLSLALRSQAVDKPTVQYYQQQFEIRSHGIVTKVPLNLEKPKDPKFLAFRRNDAFAVWDERGLTLRRGAKVSSTHLPEIPVSPHAFQRNEILETVERIRRGERSRDASGLSGAKRIGKDAYFLVRWDDKNGKPWSEALVQVDLNAPKLKPQLLGRFGGLSSATKPVDDKLLILKGKLAIVEHSGDSWGVSTFDPATQIFQTQPMGGTLISLEPLNLTQALFIETSAYGTTIAGRMDLTKGTRRILYEGRESVRFLDIATPEIVLAFSAKKTKLVNCVTGAVRMIPFPIDARRVKDDVLLWTPEADAKAVWFMDPTAWETQATWRAR